MISNIRETQRLSYKTNLIITILVFALMGIYYFIGAKFLVIYSLFLALVYFFNFYLIYKLKLRLNLWITYAMLTIYMSLCTVMLGYNYGFSLYSLSTIPLIYYMQYISSRTNSQDVKPGVWTIIIIISCTCSSLYSIKHGTFYHIDGYAPLILLGVNMLSVCSFLFGFSKLMITLILDSENKLKLQANYDALTGLSNRYYMKSLLNNDIIKTQEKEHIWVAMIDIDFFKKINDTYGHKSGDDVLLSLANIMKETCSKCNISRWGGEEFLIEGKIEDVSPDIIETLRINVEQAEITSDDKKIKFTITAGIAYYEPGEKWDTWIINADNKLYEGKNKGKNQVVY